MVRSLRWIRPIVSGALVAFAFLVVAFSYASAASGDTIFSDDFESGTFSAWSSVPTSTDGRATVQTEVVRGGSHAARLSATSTAGSHAYARKTFDAAQSDLTVTADLRIDSAGSSGNVPLLRLFDPSGTRLLSLYRQNEDRGKLYIQHSGRYNPTSGVFPLHTWGRFKLTVRTEGDLSTLLVELNGTVIHHTTSAALGSAGVETLQLGNDTRAQAFDVAADNVLVTTVDRTAPPPSDTPGGCVATDPAPTTSDPGTLVVADNFESGLGQWSIAEQGDAHVTTQSEVVRAGGCAARISVTANPGSSGNLTKVLPTGTREVWADGWFNFQEEGASTSWNTPTFRFFSDGRRVLDVSRQNGSASLFVRYPNGAGDWTIRPTGQRPSLERWYHLKIHAIADDSTSTVEVWLDGSLIFATTSATLGTSRLGVQMVGADHARQEGVVAIDDIVVKARN